MSTNYSPKVIANGLVYYFDVANQKTYNFYNSRINTSTWVAGAGGVSGYGANGPSNENQRVLDTDPFGYTSIVWETRPDGVGAGNGPDGGWEGSYFSIDKTKLYRHSVWMRRTSATTGGTFYLGLHGSPTDVTLTSTNATQTNPYWECANISKYTQNQWYLVVGHCYPWTQASGAITHANTGIYTIAGGTTQVASNNMCNITNDVKWALDCTSTMHRCYHYYCPDATSRLQLFDPRVDAIDGTEPSIADLLYNRQNKLMGISAYGHSGTLINTPIYSSSYGGMLYFDGRNDYIQLSNLGSFTDFTICSWVFGIGDSLEGAIGYNTIIGNGGANRLLYNTSGGLLAQMGAGNHSSNANVAPRGRWNYIVYRYNNATTTAQWYINGVPDTTLVGAISFSQPTSIGWYGSTNYMMNGYMSLFKIYNRNLSDDEIIQNFNATRSRFGV